MKKIPSHLHSAFYSWLATSNWRMWRFWRLRVLEFRIFILKFRYRLMQLNSIRRFLVFRCNIGFKMLAQRRKLVAKHGRGWRACVFDYEVVQFLQVENEIHRPRMGWRINLPQEKTAKSKQRK